MSSTLLLFVGAVIAAAVSGSVGFGGALLLLPLLTRTTGPTTGVPLLTIAQLVGNLSRAFFGFRAIAWRPAMAFLATAIPASLVGSYCFVELPRTLVARVIGAGILGLVLLKWRGRLEFAVGARRLAIAGAGVGFLSGLVGSAGPLGAAAFLSLDLPPVSYIATEATTAVGMHAVKLVVYGHFVALDRSGWRLAAFLSVAMVLGSWVGKKTVERLPIARFRIVVGALLVLLAIQMIAFG